MRAKSREFLSLPASEIFGISVFGKLMTMEMKDESSNADIGTFNAEFLG